MRATTMPAMLRGVTLLLGVCALAGIARAAEPTVLHVNTFPTARSLPFYAGVDRGFFLKRGLRSEERRVGKEC